MTIFCGVLISEKLLKDDGRFTSLGKVPVPCDSKSQIVYQATSRDPLVLGGVVATMALIGLVATWIPARPTLAVNPVRLLRDE